MIIIEIISKNKEYIGKVYGDDISIKKFFQNLDNQNKTPIFNIGKIEDNSIECYENDLGELLGYLEKNNYKKANDHLYYKERY